MHYSENYHSMARRIKAASGDAEKLKKLEGSLDRLWECGAFLLHEYQRMDLMILDRIVKAEGRAE